MMTYRLNFVLWRVRWVIQRLVVYFLWWAIFSQREELFGYTQSAMLTYILLSSIIGTIVLGTTTMSIGNMINTGELSNFLIRPLSFFRYFIARDVGDKLMNLAFSTVEVLLLFVLLRPPIIVPTNPLIWVWFVIAIAIGVVMYFLFSFLLGLLGFWSADIWAPRFLSFVMMEFFAGGLFPLDILPTPLFALSQSLPFSYFLYFPLKVYLGQLNSAGAIQGLMIGLLWCIGLWCLMQTMWKKGLRVYTAEGR